MKVTGSDLMKLLRMITTLSIIHNPTFWVAHDAYLSSRFKLLQVLEKYTLLGATCAPTTTRSGRSRTRRSSTGVTSTLR